MGGHASQALLAQEPADKVGNFVAMGSVKLGGRHQREQGVDVGALWYKRTPVVRWDLQRGERDTAEIRRNIDCMKAKTPTEIVFILGSNSTNRLSLPAHCKCRGRSWRKSRQG